MSKYVIALIKKDKPAGELRTSMENQMEVFLQAETPGFIAALFGAIESKEYLTTKPMKKEPEAAEEKEAAAEDKAAVADSTTPTRAEGGQQATEAAAHDEASTSGGGRGSRSERYHGRRYPPPPSRRSRSRSPPRRYSAGGRRSPSPLMSRSSRRYHRSRSRSPPPMGAYGRSRSRSPFSRINRRLRRSRSPRSYSPPPPPRRRPDSRGSTPTKDEDAANPYLPGAGGKRPRCRDYDEKGFCMRGDQCKFDHGNDAVVLEDSVTAPYNPAPVGIPSGVPPPGVGGPSDAYVPSGVPLPPLHLPPPGYTVPPGGPAAIQIDNPRKRRYDDDPGFMQRRGGPGGPGGVFRGRGRGGRGRGRGGGHLGGGNRTSQLAVRNIPPHINNIAHLNNHFARFGTLINVQVQFEGDPASALITFANPEDTEAAFSSAEAVLGNRFIKMFYHYSRPQYPRSVKDRLGAIPGRDGADEKVISLIFCTFIASCNVILHIAPRLTLTAAL